MTAGATAVVRHVPDEQRRARIAVRHGLAPACRYPSVEAAAAAMTVLHATEAATVHLALAARVHDVTAEDVDGALHVDRTVVKQLAMRRTLFAFPRDLVAYAWGSAAARTAANELRSLQRAAVAAGLTDDADSWWEHISTTALERIEEHGPVAAQQVAALDPSLDARIRVGTGKWSTEVPLGPRVVSLLGVQGLLVRVGSLGHWRTNRPTWDLSARALPGLRPADSASGYRELVRRWLWTFGPGTEEDVVWWLGSTKTVVRAALAELGAVAVSLDSGETGWLLPDDLDDVPAPEPWAALLPVLDPTTMGWKGRTHYLDPEDAPYLFDSNGNAGTTAWWNGRVVGCWIQDADGAVQVVLRPRDRERVGSVGERLLEAEAERLTRWLGGQVIASVYKSRQMKGEPLP